MLLFNSSVSLSGLLFWYAMDKELTELEATKMIIEEKKTYTESISFITGLEHLVIFPSTKAIRKALDKDLP